MKTQILIVTTLFALFAVACAPATAIAAPPEPIMTENPPVQASLIVDAIEIQILESLPVQVQVVVRGQLPDAGCTSIASIDQSLDGDLFTVTLTTTTDPLALCAYMLTPFEQVVPLNVDGLASGTYRVNVHGVEAAFDLQVDDTAAFHQALVEALNARDFETLKGMMDESFVIGYWLSEGLTLEPEAAIEQLDLNLLPASPALAADPEKDLTALLGMDPVTIAGPEVVEVGTLFTSGWGKEGQDEVILFTAQRADGSVYWYGMLFALEGFSASS